MLESCGFTSARTSGGIETPFDCDQCPLGLLLPPREPYLLRSIAYRLSFGITYFVNPMIVGLRSLNQSNKYYWIIFVLHEIETNPTSYTAIKENDFLYLLDWIKDHPEIAVATTDEITRAPSSSSAALSYYSNLYNNYVSKASAQEPPEEETTQQETTQQETTQQETTQQETTQEETTQEETTQEETTQEETTQQETPTEATSVTPPPIPPPLPNNTTNPSGPGVWIGIALGSSTLVVLIVILGAIFYKNGRDLTTFDIPEQKTAITNDDIEQQFNTSYSVNPKNGEPIIMVELNLEEEFNNSSIPLAKENHVRIDNNFVTSVDIERDDVNASDGNDDGNGDDDSIYTFL